MTLDRRGFLSAAGALSAGAVLSGCRGFTGRGSDDGAAGELTFTTWGTDSELDGFRRGIAAFTAANPGSDVKLNAVPYEQMFQNIDAQLQSGDAPDVFRVDYDNLGTYAGRGQLLNLQDLVDLSLGEDFTPAMWQAVQFDDAPHGVPHHTDTSAILYNKAALRSAGVRSVPTTLESAWTWGEFEEVALKLRADLPDDRYPFAYNWQQTGVTRWLSWLFQAGGRFLDDDLVTPAIDSAAGRRAVDFTASFFPRRLVPANSSVKSTVYASDVFFSETVAMTFAGAFLLPDAAELAPFEWGATFSPRDERGGGDLGGNALVATADARSPELAAEFLSFMVQRDQMNDFCTRSSLLPTRKDLVEGGIEFAVRPELSTTFIQQASTVEPSDAAQVASRSMAGINAVLADQLELAFAKGQSTAETLSKLSDGIAEATAR
ncbi:ABC transporter substrate-binding protein [Solicola sp. PLA-1-18]|uniref:ABC transporter substrate-binding protein n=1 Tax=Solicola sp. PLA-1-18 TaxID=3380532 RepID=UPI003B7B16F6